MPRHSLRHTANDDPLSNTSLTIQPVGGPTALINLGGLRFLTDPTFDPPGIYPVGLTRMLTKTAGPAIQGDALPAVDAVLLSHDQHPDNLDDAGRRHLARCPKVLTTRSAATRLGPPATAMAPWDTCELARPGGEPIVVTAVPARHGPEGCEDLTGEVTGFVIAGRGLPTVYISGDNASLDHVEEIAAAFPRIDVALLFAGAARTPVMDAYLTITSDEAAAAARLLGKPLVVPLHVEGWQHFTEGPHEIATSFQRASLAELLVHVPAGETFSYDGPVP